MIIVRPLRLRNGCFGPRKARRPPRRHAATRSRLFLLPWNHSLAPHFRDLGLNPIPKLSLQHQRR
jgi:hypothetical protein